jgi:hypothetical protein
MKNDYNKEKLLKALETKLNEQKMLTETLYEAFEKGSSEATLANIEDAIKDTVRSVMEIKKEIDSLNVEYKRYSDKPSNIFDSIKKEGNEDVAPKTRLEMAKEKCASANRESKYDWKHTYLDKIGAGDDTASGRIVEMNPTYKKTVSEKIQYNDIGELLNVDNILFCNRFLLDLNVIGVPETMVKWVTVANTEDNMIDVEIYDFVDENGIPVLAKLSAYDGRKFTVEIKHLNPIGEVVYKEKYNGCYLDSNISRDSLRYSDSEPSTLIIRINYDGVSYEAGR